MSNNHECVKFRKELDRDMILFLHPQLLSILFDMSFYCQKRNLPFDITSTVSTKTIDDKYKRVSDGHRTRRAFDLSSKLWNSHEIKLFQETFNKKYKRVGQISYKTKLPNLVTYHDSGYGKHFHIALNTNFRLEEINEKVFYREIPKRTRKFSLLASN